MAQIGSHVFYSFGGRGGRTIYKAGPGVYTPAPEAPRRLQTDQPKLILASALVEQPLKAEKLGMGGPAGTPPEPASAPKAEKAVEKVAEKPAA